MTGKKENDNYVWGSCVSYVMLALGLFFIGELDYFEIQKEA